jgi:glycosyltransferase involved in cell wall biosynthesis
MASLVCRIRKIPYIAHYHSENEPAGKFGFLLPFYKKIFLKKILKSANLVLVPTEDYVNIVKNNYDVSESKIRIVPNGVDNRLFKKTSHKIHNPVRILFVGRFAKEKNLSILIKAFKIVSLWNKNVILHLVGDGEEKDNILKVIKDEQVTDKIKFHGRLEGKKLYEIYSNSDIFVLTSKRESFGIVILEAMASGLPIVAPKIAAIRNVVTDGEDGILYKNTPKSLAEKIKELISSNEIREKLSNNALKKASKYDWERIVNQIENIYEEISNETKHK